MRVDFIDLKGQYQEIKEEADHALKSVLEECAFAGGGFVKAFEEDFAPLSGVKYCAAVNSGTSALYLALLALEVGPGDEVIIPANTFFATPEAVSLCGATPVFVDCNEYYNIDPSGIEKAVGPRTKGIIPVHLYGQPAEMDSILAIAGKRDLFVLEDCSQAHLASYMGKPVGSFGIAGCYSFYPSKNLGAFGEGGAVVTNDEALYRKIQALKDHGSFTKYHHERIGTNSRMEGFQGAILSVKLKHLKDWTERRRRAAELYRLHLSGLREIILPKTLPGAEPVYHLFVIRHPKREELKGYLESRGIGTGIHYPIPCPMQKAYAHLNYPAGSLINSETWASQILSLPMNEQITEEQILYVCNSIRDFQ